ncbi:MAG TPA: sensor histidine kinase [Spirochaetota bacterium]|jgi:signal transduction histidine kinase|nr:MAG: Adaptive-response sensory-kinase SasA [Spirochaetes bacterium ADurb.Bin133]HNZ26474.1 sensor histidine kinase [Spirochaetota bacterium]HQB60662.1 sensor histidine kinase [Spirochaetota bacterium]
MRSLFFSVTFALILFASLGCSYIVDKDIPSADSGVIDMSNVNFDKEIMIKLAGKWEFYHNRLYNPFDFNNPEKLKEINDNKNFIQVPSFWNKEKKDGDALYNGDSYGTYRLKIKNLRGYKFGLKINCINTSYRLWINDELVKSVGIVGKNKEQSKASVYKTEVYFDSAAEKDIILTVEVSNFFHRNGGIVDNIYIGNGGAVYKYKLYILGVQLFLLGGIIIMASYQIYLFLLWKKEFSSLFYSIFCFIMSLRLVLTGEKLFHNFFPGLDWEIGLKLEYLTFYIGSPIFCIFAYISFKDEINFIIIKLIVYFSAIHSLIVIFTNSNFYSRLIITYDIVATFGSIYLLICIIKSVARKRNGALFFLMGYLILFVTYSNDLLHSIGIIHTVMVFPYGLYLFIIFESFVVSDRFVDAFRKVEFLSNKLQLYNKILERRVEMRTKKLKKEVEEKKNLLTALDQSAKELKKVNKTKDKFFSIISHDMRNSFSFLINTITGISIGIDDINKEELEERLTLVKKNIKNVYSLFENLLVWSKSQLNGEKFEQELFNISEIVVKNIDMIKEYADSKNNIIQNNIPEFLNVFADKNMISTVIRNILSNANKFTKNGVITLSSYTEDDKIVIKISDSGVGISEEMAGKLFKIDNSISTKGTNGEMGTGLGLILCKEFVEKNFGQIWVESDAQFGSTFFFSLPFQRWKG